MPASSHTTRLDTARNSQTKKPGVTFGADTRNPPSPFVDVTPSGSLACRSASLTRQAVSPPSSRFAVAAIRAKARSPDSYIAQTGTASTFSASRCGSLVDIAELSGDLAHVLRIYLHRFISCSIPWRALVISTSMQRAPSGRNPAPPPLLITMAEASRKVCFASASAPVTSGFLIPTPSSRITDLSFTCAARKSLKAACFPAHSAVLKKLLPSAMLTRIGAPHLSHLVWYSLGTRQPSSCAAISCTERSLDTGAASHPALQASSVNLPSISNRGVGSKPANWK